MKWEDRADTYTKVVEIIKEDLPILYVLKNVIGIALRDYVKGYRKGSSMRYAWHGGGRSSGGWTSRRSGYYIENTRFAYLSSHQYFAPPPCQAYLMEKPFRYPLT